MTVEVLPCCCAVSPCPCFQTTGGYRVTWTGLVRHDPVGCTCLLGVSVPPGYSGPAFEQYTLRAPFQSGVPSQNKLWLQPSTGNPAPCQFQATNAVIFGSGIASDKYDLGSGGYCVGPQNITNPLSFSCAILLSPYRPSVGQKWRVVVNPRPFRLTFESDSTNCDPTGFYLVSSVVDPFPASGGSQPFTTGCHGEATQAIVASTLLSEGTVTLTRI